jgi:DNA polymerase lambda
VDKDVKKTTTEKQKSKAKKVKPQLVTPAEYARMLQGKAAAASAGNNDEERSLKKRKSSLVRFLEGKNIFYTGGDMKYATETTRGRMDIVCEPSLQLTSGI